MRKEEVVIYVINVLRRDYGVAFCPEEEPIFALKLLFALEELESQAIRRVRDCQSMVSPN